MDIQHLAVQGKESLSHSVFHMKDNKWFAEYVHQLIKDINNINFIKLEKKSREKQTKKEKCCVDLIPFRQNII